MITLLTHTHHTQETHSTLDSMSYILSLHYPHCNRLYKVKDFACGDKSIYALYVVALLNKDRVTHTGADAYAVGVVNEETQETVIAYESTDYSSAYEQYLFLQHLINSNKDPCETVIADISIPREERDSAVLHSKVSALAIEEQEKAHRHSGVVHTVVQHIQQHRLVYSIILLLLVLILSYSIGYNIGNRVSKSSTQIQTEESAADLLNRIE